MKRKVRIRLSKAKPSTRAMLLGGGVRVMGVKKKQKEEDLTCLLELKALIQASMKEKGITPEEAIKSIGVKRYEKNFNKIV